MLARRMGKKRVIAETGAGQHGVATATACALFGIECTVYMGEEDIRRQKLNVFNMKTLGATVVPVTAGSRTLRDATNEAMRDWMGSSRRDPLHDRERGRPAPVPEDRPRLPGHHRRRDPGPVPRQARPAARRRGRLRRRRVERGGDVLPVHRRRLGRADRRRGGRARPDVGRPRVEPDDGPARRPARQLQLRPPGRGRPDRRRPLDLGRAGLPRRRPRAQLLEGRRPGPLRGDHRRRGPRRLRHGSPGSRASCPPWSRATPSPRRSRRPPGSARARSW